MFRRNTVICRTRSFGKGRPVLQRACHQRWTGNALGKACGIEKTHGICNPYVFRRFLRATKSIRHARFGVGKEGVLCHDTCALGTEQCRRIQSQCPAKSFSPGHKAALVNKGKKLCGMSRCIRIGYQLKERSSACAFNDGIFRSVECVCIEIVRRQIAGADLAFPCFLKRCPHCLRKSADFRSHHGKAKRRKARQMQPTIKPRASGPTIMSIFLSVAY